MPAGLPAGTLERNQIPFVRRFCHLFYTKEGTVTRSGNPAYGGEAKELRRPYGYQTGTEGAWRKLPASEIFGLLMGARGRG